MKALVIRDVNDKELKFLQQLLERLGLTSSTLSEEELEDMGMSILLKNVDRKDKVSRSSVMKKLRGE